jgi:hypothetical protein
MDLDSDSDLNLPDAQPSTSAVSESERRLHARYTIHAQIEIHLQGDDVPIRLETTDLSRRGCYIQMTVPLLVGTPVRGTLWLDGYPAVFRGLVVTRHPQFGNGIAFVEFDDEGEQLLRRYVDALVG